MENAQKLVTIGIIGAERGVNTEGAYQFLLKQDYPEIELIVSIDRISDVEIADCIEFIGIYSKDNVKNVIIDFSEEERGLVQHASSIYEKSNGEILIYILNGDCFWTSNALSAIMNDFWNSFGALKGVTMLYDKNKYIGINTKEDAEWAYCFRKSMISPHVFKECSTVRELLLKMFWDIGERSGTAVSDCVLIKHDMANYNEMRVSNSLLAANWEDRKVDISARLNFTSAQRLLQIIDEILIDREKGMNLLVNEVKDILNYRSRGKWGISSCDELMLDYLQKIKSLKDYENLILHIQKNKRNKIKIVAVCDEFSIWQSCIQSIYQEIIRDERFEIHMVYVPFSHEDKSEQDIAETLMRYEDAGIPIKIYHKYALEKENPDFIIYTKPYHLQGGWDIKDTSKIVPKSIYVPYSMWSEHESKKLIYLSFQLPLHFLAWKRLSYSKKETKEILEYGYNKENHLCIGHPRFDITIDDLGKQDQELYKFFKKKAGNRKIFFWNTHFNLEAEVDGVARGTFLLLGEKILEYFKENKDIFLIWRPHPFFWNCLAKKTGNLNIKEYYIDMLQSYDNIYLDCQKSYYPALFASDALISDHSAIMIGYLSTHKPIIFTKRIKENSDEENEHYYFGYTFKDVYNFILDIIDGRDVKKDIREEFIKHNFYLDSEKKCARKLLDLLLDCFSS